MNRIVGTFGAFAAALVQSGCVFVTEADPRRGLAAPVEPPPRSPRTVEPFFLASAPVDSQSPSAFVMPLRESVTEERYVPLVAEFKELGPAGPAGCRGVLHRWSFGRMELSVEDRERMKALEAGEGGPDAARQDMGEMLAQSWRWSRNCDYIFRSWRGADGAWDDGSTAVLRSEPDATYDEEVLTTYLSWRSPREGPLAGVVVHLTNIEGARIESTIIKRMVALGWGVLSVNPSATGTRHLGKMSLSGPSTGAEAAGGSQRRVAAELLAWKASAYGQYLFESTSQSAYASEAVLDDLPCIDQRTIGLPVVVVGVSNGAMLAPGVAALLGERIRAVVVIAGGGTYFDVAATSSLVRDRPSPEAYARVRDKVLGDYLALNPLDPIAAAPMISRTPVLQIVPMFDHIVPTRLQMDLWRALGRPERWDLPCGHIGTILLQSSIAKRVDGWLRDQLRVQGVARFHDDTR